MTVVDGTYITGAVFKRTLHISHTDYDSEISDCIRFAEGKINTLLNGHASTPITKDNDIEQIAVMLATSRFDLLYRENLTPDLYTRAKELGKAALIDLEIYIGDNYGGRVKYAKPNVTVCTPDGNTNMLTDLFA